MSHRTAREGFRILICAPYGRDAASVAQLLGKDGYDARVFGNIADLAAAIDDETGALLLTEEAFGPHAGEFKRVLGAQPPWSDVPFIVLSGGPVRGRSMAEKRVSFGEVSTNSIVLERPLGLTSLLSAVASALRSRQKQFDMRDRLKELADGRDEIAEERLALEILNRTGARVAAELELEQLVQTVVDAGLELTSARFAAFFYNAATDGGESYMLYSLAGVSREAFGNFPMPRNTGVFAPTFRGEGIVRSADITADPRYGKNKPHSGMPKGHLPVRSYLAAPVISRSGEVIGGLFFGHEDANQFEERHEKLAAGLSSQAAIGIDNARLFQAAQRVNQTLEERVEQRTQALHAEMETRIKTEEALRQSQKMEAVGQLTGGIAHDFNNMLTGVIGSFNLVRRRLSAGRISEVDEIIEAGSSAAQRAAGLTHRLLAFSRRQSLDTKASNVRDLITALDSLIQRSMRENISVEYRHHETELFAFVDANQLESAILNLSINARDAMPDGGTLTIQTSERIVPEGSEISAGRYVTVSVHDTGVGIAPEILPKLFEPFFTTKPIGQGTGLGLSMVYGFAKQSNGQVKVESKPGAGTTVTLWLPAAEADHEQAANPTTQVTQHGAGQRILLVEDDPQVRMLLRTVLTELGYAILETKDGSEALPVLRSEEPIDLMVSDVGLPGLTGRQLAEIAREHRPELPILFVTGYAENAAIRSSFVGQNMSMIMKPFTFEVLSAKVAEMLG